MTRRPTCVPTTMRQGARTRVPSIGASQNLEIPILGHELGLRRAWCGSRRWACTVRSRRRPDPNNRSSEWTLSMREIAERHVEALRAVEDRQGAAQAAGDAGARRPTATGISRCRQRVHHALHVVSLTGTRSARARHRWADLDIGDAVGRRAPSEPSAACRRTGC